MRSAYRRLQVALAVFGVVFLLLYPVSAVWPSGWQWHVGPPHGSAYFMMIVGLYATLGIFLLKASRKPENHLSLIWFTVWSSGVHAAIMAVQSFSEDQLGHLWGDVAGLLLVSVVLSLLVRSANLEPSRVESPRRA